MYFECAIGDYFWSSLSTIPRPCHQKGVQSTALVQAIDQTIDWCSFIQDNLSTVRGELGLTGIPPNPRRLVVIVRTSTLGGRMRRKIEAIQEESPTLKGLTYDDLRNEAPRSFENVVGSLGLQPGQTEIYYPQTNSLFWRIPLAKG